MTATYFDREVWPHVPTHRHAYGSHVALHDDATVWTCTECDAFAWRPR